MIDADAILIAGPTASGKSALALAAAQAVGGVVINADSMQVYDGLRVLTARPSEEEESLVPHRLYGTVAPHERYSVGRWLEDISDLLTVCKIDGRMPVIVGGTGLYFLTLLEGLSPVPDIPDAIRTKWRGLAKELSAGEAHRILQERDSEMAEMLRPSDLQRIVRALEVLEATGRSLKVWQETPGVGLLDFKRVSAFVVAPDRDVLYARCDRRFDQMVAGGAIEEVGALLALDLAEDLPIMGALGLRPFRAYLRGEIGMAEAVQLGKRDTRRYAKRQMTWARGNMLAWNWLFAQDMERLETDFFAFCDD